MQNALLNKAIEDKVKYELDLTKYAEILRNRSDKSKLDLLCSFRGFDRQTVEDCGIFYIGDMAEMILPQYISKLDSLGVISETNKKPIFRNRWVIPILNQQGLVQNFVGYSPSADERYIYGTSLYYRRRSTLYGLENLNLAYDMGYAFITEGITDTIRLRDIGFKNSFAMCGTHVSDHMIEQLNRCRNGVILIPDRDDAGLRAHKNWKFNRSATIFVNHQFKDIDEMLRIKHEDGTAEKNLENIEWFKEYVDMCVDWIVSDEHRGHQCICEKVAMV